MKKELFNKRKTYHLIPDNEDWKIVEEIIQFVPLKKGKNKSDLLKEVVKLARSNKPSRIVIYKSNGSLQEHRTYGSDSLPPTNSTEEIVSQLKVLTEDLYYPSESDYPFEIHTQSVSENLIQELYKISGKPKDSLTENVSFGKFFESLIPQDWMDEDQKKNAGRFLKLKQYLEAALNDLLVTRIGKIQIDVFITGKTDNEYIILKSTSIET